jgi:hypothetical protein
MIPVNKERDKINNKQLIGYFIFLKSNLKVVAINMGYFRNIRNFKFSNNPNLCTKTNKKNQLIKFKLVAVNKKINKGTQSMEDVNAYKVHFNCIDIYVRV